jgi:hypothetical protein
MKDFLGKNIELGASVVIAAPGYRILVKGTVVGFTPKKVYIEYINNWNYGASGRPVKVLQETRQIVCV